MYHQYVHYYQVYKSIMNEVVVIVVSVSCFKNVYTNIVSSLLLFVDCSSQSNVELSGIIIYNIILFC